MVGEGNKMTGWPFLSTFAGADVVLGLDVQPCVAIIESSLMLVGSLESQICARWLYGHLWNLNMGKP